MSDQIAPQHSGDPPPKDMEAEQEAARVFESVYSLDAAGRQSALVGVARAAPNVLRIVEKLLSAHDLNVRDRFLELAPAPVVADVNALIEGGGPEDETPEAPTSLGSYRVVRLLAERDACAVYLGETPGTPARQAAIKVLQSTSRRRETLRRFEAERRVIGDMRHPNIAEFFEAGTTPSGRAFFAMEYVQGPSIVGFATESRLPLRARLELFLQVCEAVTYAHQRGIIHRDLKPSNILVAANDGKPATAKVIDFGIAKALTEAQDDRATQTGVAVGTPAYMSPEQLRADPDLVDTRSDVFSLGLVLFELLAERPAFPTGGGGGSGGGFRTPESAPAPAASIHPRLASDLVTIISKATALDPGERYGTVAGLSTDIRRFLDGLPILARRHSFMYVCVKYVRRHWLASGLGVVFALGITGAISVAWHARTERTTLALEFADAWLHEALRMQRTMGERGRREPVVSRLVEEARGLAHLAPGDPRVRAILAGAITEAGYLRLERGEPLLAAEHFAEALEIRKRLADEAFGKLEGLDELSLAIVRCGNAANEAGDHATRDRLYAEALAIDERVAREHPTDPVAVSNLGWSYERTASVLAYSAERVSVFERQAAVFHRLLELKPGADAYRGLCSAHLNMAFSKRALKIPCLDDSDKAVEYAQAALRDSPDDRLCAAAAVRSLSLNAELRAAPGERVERYRSAISIAERAYRADPKDKDSVDHLTTALESATNNLSEADDEASRAFRAAASSRLAEIRAAGPPVP